MRIYNISYDGSSYMYFEDKTKQQAIRIDETGWFGKYWPLSSITDEILL